MPSSPAVYLRDCSLRPIYLLKSLFLDINVYPSFCSPDINLNGSIWIYPACTAKETEHSQLLCTHRELSRLSALVPSCSVTQTCTQQPSKAAALGTALHRDCLYRWNKDLQLLLTTSDRQPFQRLEAEKQTKKEYNNVKTELLSCSPWECK